jgi:hypothetical protein
VNGPILLTMPDACASAIAAEVRRFGQETLETGGFLLAPVGTTKVSLVAFAGDSGILRRWGLFQIHEIAVGRLFDFAENQGLWIPAQFHSHMFDDELSRTDREYGTSVQGFVSAVVPEYLEPPTDPARWGWWAFDSHRWLRVAAPSVTESGTEVVMFDRDGIHGA